MKRVSDILVRLVLSLLASPLLVLIALAIRFESQGPIMFRQRRRLSRRSGEVLVLKFRSMWKVEDRPDTANGAENGMKSPGDPRITRVGRIIRKYSLDELPQLFNVLVGEMSLVGPRPLPLADFDKLPAALASLLEMRAVVKPGLTGLWQISGRSGLNFQQMVTLDLYYAENQSFLFDLEILCETIPAVISGRGAY
jgi:lipopolysaccharide/colanic/teichoic acid biosynthesis glycosyltransferase